MLSVNWVLVLLAFDIVVRLLSLVKGFVDVNAAGKIIAERAKSKKSESEKNSDDNFSVGPVWFLVTVLIAITGFTVTFHMHEIDNKAVSRIGEGRSAATSQGHADHSEPAQPARETVQPDFIDDHRQTQTPCSFRPGSDTFQADTDACIAASNCDAAVRLCLGAAASLGRRVVPDLLCPYSLGEAVSLWERQELDRKFRLRRCYPESYAWLAGMKGAAADTARAYWRTVVCPENPTVFDDRQFDPFRPLPFAACPN